MAEKATPAQIKDLLLLADLMANFATFETMAAENRDRPSYPYLQRLLLAYADVLECLAGILPLAEDAEGEPASPVLTSAGPGQESAYVR